MCYGFGAVYVAGHKELYFIEPDRGGDVSHDAIITRMIDSHIIPKRLTNGETSEWFRNHIRFESPHWEWVTSRVDGEIPSWFEPEMNKQFARFNELLGKVFPIWKEYKETYEQLIEEYKKRRDEPGYGGHDHWTKYVRKPRHKAYCQMTKKLRKIKGYLRPERNYDPYAEY